MMATYKFSDPCRVCGVIDYLCISLNTSTIRALVLYRVRHQEITKCFQPKFPKCTQDNNRYVK